MVDKVLYILKLFAISAKLDLMWLLRDTKYAIVGILADMFSNVAAVSGVFLIAVRFGGIGGMSTNEVLFMMAYSTMVTGLFILFGSGNNIHISRIIGRGQLEHLFIQPVPFSIQLVTSGFAPFTGGGNFILGILLMLYTIGKLEITPTFGWMVSLCCYLTATMVTIVARAYLVSSLAFYAPVAAEEITYHAIEGTWFLSTFPLSGMPQWLQIPLLTFLPEGLMAWFPALCLLGRPPFAGAWYYPLLFAIVISMMASVVFRKGWMHYVSKGSNRYVPYGFRR